MVTLTQWGGRIAVVKGNIKSQSACEGLRAMPEWYLINQALLRCSFFYRACSDGNFKS